MSLMNIAQTVAITVGVGAVYSLVKGYFQMRMERPTLEKSFLLRKHIITRYSSVIRSLNARDKAIRRIILDDKDALKVDTVQSAYEALLEFSLSSERSEIDHLANHAEAAEIIRQLHSSLGKSAFSPISSILNAGLLTSYMRLILTSVSSAASTSSSIVGVMLGERIKAYNRAYMLLLLSLLLTFAFSFVVDSRNLLSFGSIFSLLMLGGLAANQKILAFRIKSGFYGSNAGEALELLRFIDSHSDKSDFSDGDSAKRISPRLEASDPADRVVYGQGVTA